MIAEPLLAGGCALAGSASVLLKQRGATATLRVIACCPVRSAVGIFRSECWTAGWSVALAAWRLHVGARSLSSLSIMRTLISAGPVCLGDHRGAVLRLSSRPSAVDRRAGHRDRLTVLGLTAVPVGRLHAGGSIPAAPARASEHQVSRCCIEPGPKAVPRPRMRPPEANRREPRCRSVGHPRSTPTSAGRSGGSTGRERGRRGRHTGEAAFVAGPAK